MQPVLNVEDVRTLEESLTRAGVSISELMRRAGAAAANEVLAMGEVGHATVFSGFGNNGGDGWVAAEELLRKGVRVSVITPVPADEIGSDLARVVAQGALSVGVEALVAPPRSDVEELLAQTDVVVDCMFGTGFHGTARTPFDIWIDCVNASGARVLAVDVPSGLSAQTGHIEGPCVVADETITMLTLKPGLLSDKGRDVCGAIVVAPLAEQTDELAVQADPVRAPSRVTIRRSSPLHDGGRQVHAWIRAGSRWLHAIRGRSRDGCAGGGARARDTSLRFSPSCPSCGRTRSRSRWSAFCRAGRGVLHARRRRGKAG